VIGVADAFFLVGILCYLIALIPGLDPRLTNIGHGFVAAGLFVAL
jgi:hypothetical protein